MSPHFKRRVATRVLMFKRNWRQDVSRILYTHNWTEISYFCHQCRTLYVARSRKSKNPLDKDI